MSIYLKIEEAVNQENFQIVLDELKETFDELESNSQNLVMGIYENPEEAYKLMLRSAGHWEILKAVHTTIDTIKSNREKVFVQKKKMEIEADPKGKFVVSAVEGEASALTVDLRRLRNIVGAYMDMADRNITVCQSFLKYVTEANKRTVIQEG